MKKIIFIIAITLLMAAMPVAATHFANTKISGKPTDFTTFKTKTQHTMCWWELTTGLRCDEITTKRTSTRTSVRRLVFERNTKFIKQPFLKIEANPGKNEFVLIGSGVSYFSISGSGTKTYFRRNMTRQKLRHGSVGGGRFPAFYD